MLRREEIHEGMGISEVGQDLGAERLRHGWYLTNGADLDKTRIPHGFEVAIETSIRIGGGVDKRVGKVDLEVIHPLQYQGVGIQDPDLFDQGGLDIGTATHTSVFSEQPAGK